MESNWHSIECTSRHLEELLILNRLELSTADITALAELLRVTEAVLRLFGPAAPIERKVS